MKKNRDCNCKTKKNVETVLKTFNKPYKPRKNILLTFFRVLIYTLFLFFIGIFIFPFIIYILFSKKNFIISKFNLIK